MQAYDCDILNRLTSDATPAVTYNYYLSGALNVGELHSVTSAAATAGYAYDALGRVTAQQQTVAGNPNIYLMAYTHWLNGQPKTVRLPSGRELAYSVDDAGRLTEVAGPDGMYADLTAAAQPYTADGRIAQLRLGNELWETRDYRTPGTPTRLKLGTTAGANDRIELEYNYAGTTNNGNLLSHVIRQPGFTRTQSYSYDGVNRLASASEGGGFSRSYGYDRWGNRWVATSSGLTYANAHEPASVNHFSAATNRTNVAGATFDAVGNQTYYAPYTLAYDAESRLISSTSASNGNAAYLYDGDGKRVKKVWTPHGGSPVTTYYIYDAAGQLAAEYQDPAPTQTGTSYVFTDMLGSVRAVSGEKPPSGTATLTECHDYLPFGRPLSQSDNRSGMTCYPANPELQLTSSLPQKFTGQERDEFGLDFFQARYLSPGQGRFVSADPLLSSGTVYNPQTWNRYSYALNNPFKYTDPTGMYICDGTEEECENFAEALKRVATARDSFRSGSDQYNRLNSVLNAYGQVGVDNGVTVGFGSVAPGLGAETAISFNVDSSGLKSVTPLNPTGQNIRVMIDLSQNGSRDVMAVTAAHEGSHVADGSALIGALPMNLVSPAPAITGPLNLTQYATETRAYEASSFVGQGLRFGSLTVGGGFEVWNSGWRTADIQTLRSRGINGVLGSPTGPYAVTPDAPGRKLIP